MTKRKTRKMREIRIIEQVSLDGVIQAPGGPDEDRDGDYAHGGWAMRYCDTAILEAIAAAQGNSFDLLLGRRTYDIFASYWPLHEKGFVGKPFKECKKYVVSRSQIELPWVNSELITDDVVAKLQALKAGDGPMLQVHGSGDLIQTLLREDLVDELFNCGVPAEVGAHGERVHEVADCVRPS